MNSMIDQYFSTPDDEREYWEEREAYEDYLAERADEK